MILVVYMQKMKKMQIRQNASRKEKLCKAIRPLQILEYFGHHEQQDRKVICPFHNDTDASLYLNEDFVFCFGCNRSWDIFQLVEDLADIKGFNNQLSWLEQTDLPEISNQTYTKSKYEGAVPLNLVQFWHNNMQDTHYAFLEANRGILKATAQRFGIGWRPDNNGYVVPFWRGVPFESEIDIVQFRLQDGKTKYIGLKNHNRGSVINAELLNKRLPYLIVVFGTFDPILAWQDRIYMVGTNGSNPFKKEEKERVQALFKNHKNIVIVPDNSPGEFKPAYQLRDWIGGEVRFYPDGSEPGMDYIKYRQTHTAQEFLTDVAKLAPTTPVKPELVEDLVDLLGVGDSMGLAQYHIEMRGRGIIVSDLAKALALAYPPKNFTQKNWWELQQCLYSVRTLPELLKAFDFAGELLYTMNGGW